MTGSLLSLRATLAVGALATLAGLHCSAPSDPSRSSTQGVTGSAGPVHPFASSSLCLDVAGQSTANGAAVQVWSCSGNANQQWSYDGTSLRVYGSKCLDVTNGNTTDGTKLQIWDCAPGNPNQMWTLSGSTLRWTNHGSCLDLTGGVAANGTAAQTWTCFAGDVNQQWTFGGGGGGSGSGSGSGGGSGSGSGSGGTPGASTEYAPYFPTWVWGGSGYAFTSLADLQRKAGLDGVTIAFVLSNGGCDTTQEIEQNLGDVNAFVAAGGHVKASFGGAAGAYVESRCGSAGALASAIEGFVDATGITDLDFDIEQDPMLTDAMNAMRGQALAQVQKSRGIKVAFTLAANPPPGGGLTSQGMSVVRNAVAAGVTVSHVNFMTMDYGDSFGGQPLGPVVTGTLSDGQAQIMSLVPGISPQGAWAMVGVIPMIGKNDDAEIFSLSDAQTLAQFAKSNGVGLVSFWSIDRDQLGSDYNVSSTVQSTDFAFNAILGTVAQGGSSSGGSSGGGSSGGGSSSGGSSGGAAQPDFGPNVLVFDPSMSSAAIQTQLDAVYSQQQQNQFGNERFAIFFKPGTYDVDVNLGFYVTAHGLGASPDDVTIRGAVRSKADWFNGNATQNFWRGAENLSVAPQLDGNVDIWAVSQGTALRRVHVKGNIDLWDAGFQNAWSSGGFIADSKIDGSINSGTQQQFLTRNTDLGWWQGSNWNMVFVGDNAAPGNAWPNGAYTTVASTPVIREKPYLVLDPSGAYAVKVPPLTTNSAGTTWAGGTSPGTLVGLDQFYVAHADRDNAATMNAALAGGKHLLLTPGVYSLESALSVNKPDTIVLGLGLATLRPVNGNDALDVADVDGVTIAGILFDAGAQSSSTLLKVGPVGNAASHAADPILLADVFCRVGGAGAAQTSSCVLLNANDTLIDNSWLWRADHGSGVGWDTNPAANGLVVNGVGVSAYGLFVEHFEAVQTQWNADRGRVYFYQSEIPYDVPSQDRWMDSGVNGYASFKVADWVTTFDARGLGAYAFFFNPVVLENAFKTPAAAGVSFQHLITVWLGQNGGSAINHIINGDGATVRSGVMTARTNY